MRATQYFISTLKETPKDAEITSHQLMLRAGLIRKLGSGLYTWMPLGLKVLRKVEAIVREEMNRAGALELLMPAVQPAELWMETGRWESFGGQLLVMKDSNERDYCFGPTHEEVITDLIRQEVQSYKQLPLNLYQIQTKFRDEIRPRFGVMRAREFIMKDAYSFHLTHESLQQTYEAMVKAYTNIFNRMGLRFRAVEADTGAIGGSASHEFQVLADAGEDLIFYSDQSAYAANVEQATAAKPEAAKTIPQRPLERVATPHKKTIEEVAQFLHSEPQALVKTLIVEGQDDPFVALVLRGDDTLSEIKAAKHPKVKAPLTLANEDVVLKQLGTPMGFVGPVHLNLPIIADHQALAMETFICGANEADFHYQNASFLRDVKSIEAFDLRVVKEGDKSPDDVGHLKMCRGIEVGHVFQLGDKYAKAMKAEVVTEEGQNQTLLMGCYGLGISRVVAAAIEQHHDSKGILWPAPIAPFDVVIIPINANRNQAVLDATQALYQQCLEAGLDVLLDDRPERPGVLFADHDLIGIPHRLVMSEKHLASHAVEYKARTGNEAVLIPQDGLLDFIQQQIKSSLEPKP